MVAEGWPADVVTTELVRDLYETEAVVLRDPAVGTAVVCPVRRLDARR